MLIPQSLRPRYRVVCSFCRTTENSGFLYVLRDGRVYTMHTVHVFVCSCVNVITQIFRLILMRSALMSDWTIRQ